MQVSANHETITKLVTKDLQQAAAAFEASATQWRDTASLLDQALKDFGGLENFLEVLTAESESIMRRACDLSTKSAPQ
jgi:hypothetical protein